MSTANSEAARHGDVHPEGASLTAYTVVFVALMALLFISVGVAFIPSQKDRVRDLLTLIGFSIAGTKAILVILYFMHVKFSSRLTWIFAFSSFFFLLIMVWLTLNDYNTREQLYGTVYQNLNVVEPTGHAREEGPTAEPQSHNVLMPNNEKPPTP